MKTETVISWFGSVFAAGASINAEMVGERSVAIITAIIAAISGLVSIAYTIWKWYKHATDKNSEGGEKITLDEAGKLIEEVHEELNSKEDK